MKDIKMPIRVTEHIRSKLSELKGLFGLKKSRVLYADAKLMSDVLEEAEVQGMIFSNKEEYLAICKSMHTVAILSAHNNDYELYYVKLRKAITNAMNNRQLKMEI